MKFFLKMAFSLSFFAACSHAPSQGTVREEKNQANFAKEHSFSSAPEQVMRAAKMVLEKLSRASSSSSKEKLKEEGNSIFTSWLEIPASRDKYVEFLQNGLPKRKPLQLRRIYGYQLSPSLSGTDVIFHVEEEVQQIDLKTGAHQGWKKASPDPAAFDMLLRLLQEEIRSE